MEGLTALKKRRCPSSEDSSHPSEGESSSCFSAFNVAPVIGSPSAKRVKDVNTPATEGQVPASFHFIWDYHAAAQQPPLPGCGQLQPADSSTVSHINQWVSNSLAADVFQQADQMDCDSRPGLVRTSSAPELLKLAQADSAAWQAMHAAGGNTMQQSAFLSHHDHWLT